MKRCAACGKETNLISGLGGVLLCQGCRAQIEIKIAELRAQGKQINVAVMARRMYNRDNTSTGRVNRRNEELNKMAQRLGYDSLSRLLTAWKNGEIDLVVRSK